VVDAPGILRPARHLGEHPVGERPGRRQRGRRRGTSSRS
jgi:hypothetical protein